MLKVLWVQMALTGPHQLSPFSLPHRQQDAQEFAVRLFQHLHAAGRCVLSDISPRRVRSAAGEESVIAHLLRYEKYQDPSWIGESCTSTLMRAHRCGGCGHGSLSFESQMVMQIPIPAATTEEPVSILDCVAAAVAHEQLDLYYCDASDCQYNAYGSKAVRFTRIGRTSDTLIFSFLRFERLSVTVYEKKEQAVNVAEIIDIAEFCNKDALLEMGSEGTKYKLCGICHHEGTLKEGHYWATCKAVSDGRWRLFDDARVQDIECPAGPSQTAYMVIYSRI